MSEENQTNVLDSLVGDGKKFKSVEDLAKGKLESDTFIEVLKGQIETLKTEIEKGETNADRKKILENLMSSLNQSTTNQPNNPSANQPSDGKNNQTAGLSHDDVVKIVEAQRRAEQEANNVAKAYEPVRKAFGDKTDEVLAARAKELGLTVDALISLAKQSPQAFINVVGLPTRDSSTGAMANHNSVNSNGGTAATGGVVRNKAYYDNLQKEMGPRKFAFDTGLQIQLHKDMMRLGDQWDS